MKISYRLSLFALAILCIFLFISLKERMVRSALPEIHFLDVGQGDAILLVSPEEHQILVDGGAGDRILSVLPKYLPYGDKHLDALVLTHPHADHLEGLVHVLKYYKVDTIYMSAPNYSSELYGRWMDALQKFQGEMIFPEDEMEVSFGTFLIDFLYPYDPEVGKVMKNINNASLVFRLIVETSGRTAFFSGDAELEVESSLLEQVPSEQLKSEIMKAGHHGSATSNSIDLVRAIDADTVVISSGEANSYGHPHQEALNVFQQLAMTVYRTDQDGSLSFYDLSSVSKCDKSWHLKTAIEVLMIRIRDQCS